MRTYNYVILSFCAEWKSECKQVEEEMLKAAKLSAHDADMGYDVVYATVDLTRGKSLGRMFNITKIPHIYKFISFEAFTDNDGKRQLGVNYDTYAGKRTGEDIYMCVKMLCTAYR
jgi:hypothetical protein